MWFISLQSLVNFKKCFGQFFKTFSLQLSERSALSTHNNKLQNIVTIIEENQQEYVTCFMKCNIQNQFIHIRSQENIEEHTEDKLFRIFS